MRTLDGAVNEAAESWADWRWWRYASVIVSAAAECRISQHKLFFNFFTSQYKNRLFTIIIRGCRLHGSFITVFKHSMTPSISRFPFTSIQIMEGADPTIDFSQTARIEAMSLGSNMSPRINLHLGNLGSIISWCIPCMRFVVERVHSNREYEQNRKKTNNEPFSLRIAPFIGNIDRLYWFVDSQTWNLMFYVVHLLA